jgi:hypothetical protein
MQRGKILLYGAQRMVKLVNPERLSLSMMTKCFKAFM